MPRGMVEAGSDERSVGRVFGLRFPGEIDVDRLGCNARGDTVTKEVCDRRAGMSGCPRCVGSPGFGRCARTDLPLNDGRRTFRHRHHAVDVTVLDEPDFASENDLVGCFEFGDSQQSVTRVPGVLAGLRTIGEAEGG